MYLSFLPSLSVVKEVVHNLNIVVVITSGSLLLVQKLIS